MSISRERVCLEKQSHENEDNCHAVTKSSYHLGFTFTTKKTFDETGLDRLAGLLIAKEELTLMRHNEISIDNDRGTLLEHRTKLFPHRRSSCRFLA